MCNFLSVIVLRDNLRILRLPGVDSHELLIKHFNLRELGGRDASLQHFARLEYVPDWTKDVTRPEAWSFKIDESVKPKWLDDDARARVLRDLWTIVETMLVRSDSEKVVGDYIVVGESRLTLCHGRAFLLANSSATLYSNSTATLCANSSAKLCNNSSAKLYDNSKAKQIGSRATIIGKKVGAANV